MSKNKKTKDFSSRKPSHASEVLGSDELQMLRRFFRDEVEDTLERITTQLAQCAETPPNTAIVADIMRATHTLKGSAGTVGLEDVVHLTHRLEDRFTELRSIEHEWTTRSLDFLIQCIDSFREYVDAKTSDSLNEETLERVKKCLGSPAPNESSDGIVVQEATTDTTRTIIAQMRQTRQTDISRDQAADSAAPEDRKHDVLRVDPNRIDDLIAYARELASEQVHISQHASKLRLVAANVRRIHISLRNQIAEAKDSVPEEFRDRLDILEGDFAEQLSNLSAAGTNLLDGTNALRGTCANLHLGLANIRVLSVQTLFQRLAPTVRRIARTMNKHVKLHITGQKTELDKALAEQITDPLVHLLCNAVAHGIETEQERERLQKPEEGTIGLGARYEDDCIVLEVSDDGSGIDPEILRRQFVASGRWTQSRARRASDEQILQAIFDPGISTRAEADYLAGRGVGLDAVRDAIGRLGGEVRMTTTPGRGTRFSLVLPATTTVNQALLFRELAPTRILLVDDSATIREAASKILLMEGHRVDLANNGAEAWRELKKTRYDIVVTDLEMPEVDGFELIKNIRSDRDLCHLGIVVISSKATRENREHAVTLHVQEFVAKPITGVSLIMAVRTALTSL